MRINPNGRFLKVYRIKKFKPDNIKKLEEKAMKK